MFADGSSNLANSVLADQTTEIKEGLMRYQVFRFSARIGFKPPYFYHDKLSERLYRFSPPAKYSEKNTLFRSTTLRLTRRIF